MPGYFLVAVIAFVIGNFFGWSTAHEAVANECARLVGFYVGGKTYKCELIEGADVGR